MEIKYTVKYSITDLFKYFEKRNYNCRLKVKRGLTSVVSLINCLLGRGARVAGGQRYPASDVSSASQQYANQIVVKPWRIYSLRRAKMKLHKHLRKKQQGFRDRVGMLF